uniref:PDZ domain-containing protein n=1 Tax=Scleropages formosus TaxID=113540 RepID=A0A8C9T0R3_SCLFO
MSQTEVRNTFLLVVTQEGGGKEGIFVKEVKPESPASKQLGVKEGDQILSATVYFDDVSYEDALQILEHAQACKMELCLKRKTPSTQSTLERSTDTHLEMISTQEDAKDKTKRQKVKVSKGKMSLRSKSADQ